jgi:quercetin dioxygenase-like cupin family protein
MTTTTATTPASAVAVVRGPADGDATWFLNGLTTQVVDVAETGGAYGITEHLITAASNPPLHRHLDEDEAFYVLEGTVEVEIDGVVATATPGTYAFAPRGVPHTFRVVSPAARMLVFGSGKVTDGIEDFFFAMGDPAPERRLPEPSAPDVDRLVSLAGRSGIELLA